ncbi:YtxH domain-containing protein [Winogradskyella sp. 3972H.M.0a.05]|uniref:YtxH domain-containing protein n=1 Tax=Winogradskyella sp. 3972H.M.0a.05 TaxID=2950277 RepID=UPI003397784F
MSDEKSLGDDLNDMLGDAKEGAKKAADKAGEFASDAADKAKEFASDAKEKASEFADDAKEKFNEFSDDAKEVMSDGKNVAIIAHITLIGWIIALIMNSGEKKSEFASFYIRQMLGIFIIGFILGIIPVINLFAWILTLILWIMSLVGAIGGKKKPIFLLGEQFQDWFKSL